MLKGMHTPKSVKEKLAAFMNDSRHRSLVGEKISFSNGSFRSSDDFIYNPSDILFCSGHSIMAARCGSEREVDDISVFYYEIEGVWYPLENAPVFQLQDPNMVKLGDEIVFSGVNCSRGTDGNWRWHCDFYKGKTIRSLAYFLSGPTKMKDIRMTALSGGEVGIFTRPQGIAYRKVSGHLADIGFTKARCLDDISVEALAAAPCLDGLFLSNEWGGVNQVYPLSNGLLGVLGHIAYGDGEFREGLTVHYYAMTFAFDPMTGIFTDPKIIACRNQFAYQKDRVYRNSDVLFPSGLKRLDNGKAVMHCGVADRFVAKLTLDDPFIEYESL